MVKVFVERENKTKKVDAKTAKELLIKLNINPETVIVVRNNELIIDETKLKNNDEVKLLSVISGG